LKILLLTRYFAPEPSGAVRRLLHMVNQLEEEGHEVFIGGPEGIDYKNSICAKHPDFPSKAYSSDYINIENNIKSIGFYLRTWFLLPDPEIRWVLNLTDEILKSGKKFDLVISTSPPESLHIAAYILKAKTGVKWCADFRDPWISPSQREILNNPFRAFIENNIAKFIFKKCDEINAVSQAVMNDTYRYAGKKIKRLVVGHKALKFDGAPFNFPKDTLNLVHTGSISLSNPLSEFAPLLDEFEVFASVRPEARLWLAGRLSGDELDQIDNFKYKDKIIYLGQKSIEEARALQLGADALVLVSGKKSHALPGKFAEYILTKKPILLVNTGDWCKLLPDLPNIHDFKDANKIL